MLRPIGIGAVDYYWRGPDPGYWSGRGALALGLGGVPNPETLTRVLAGRHPDSGERLGHAHSHRRAGWDLIFAAPKSVSLLAALAPTGDARTMIMAHRQAVAETVGWIEAEVAWARRPRTRVAARGVVAAVFEHGNNARGEPHLHTHVLLANLVEGPDGRWSALDQSNLWLERRAISAIYDLALRHQAGRHWSRLRWRLDERGLADVAGVPREAIEAVSVRRREVLRDLGNTKAGGAASPRLTRYASARTRVEPSNDDWRTRLAQTGFRPADAAALLAPALPGSRRATGSGLGEPTEAAEGWLTDRGSTWSPSDAIQALATTIERGAPPASTMTMVAELCRRALPAGPGRWSTVAARRLDESVARAATVPIGGLPVVRAAIVDEMLDRRPGLSAGARQAVRHLVCQPVPVSVLCGTPGQDRLVEQAAVLDAARASWQASGVRVAVEAGPNDVARWTALAGLGAAEPRACPGVIVADRADRRTSAELLDLLTRAAREAAIVVLVEGGTLPARREPRSAALIGLGSRRGLDGSGGVEERSSPSTMDAQARPAHQSGRIVATSTTADAVGTIVTRWAMLPEGRRPMMVALGPPEAEVLNRLARDALIAAGEVGAGRVVIGGRAFAPGDRVLARRPGPAPSASLGTVESVTQVPPTVTVRWDAEADRASRVDAWNAQRLVHAYATTAGVATRLPGPLLLLGDPSQAPGLAHREVTAIVIAPTRDRRRDPLDRLTRITEIAREASGSLPARRLPLEAESLGTLAARRDRLEAELRAGLPPDPGNDRRRLDEDLAYYATTYPRRPRDADDLELRAAELARSEAAFARWQQANTERLVLWSELSRLVDERSELVAHAAVADPGSTAQLVTGPVPPDPGLRPVWERAVHETAIHAARWQESGRELERAAGRSLAELASLRRRDQALRALQVTRDRRVERDVMLRTFQGRDIGTALDR